MAAFCLERVPIKVGERFFREGESGDKAYVIESGQVEFANKWPAANRWWSPWSARAK